MGSLYIENARFRIRTKIDKIVEQELEKLVDQRNFLYNTLCDIIEKISDETELQAIEEHLQTE